MYDFKHAAGNYISGSPLMVGREKSNCDDLIEKYNGLVTVTEFDILPGQNGAYAVFLIAEDQTVYCNGGTVLTNLFQSWVSNPPFNGDVKSCSKGLKDSGGLRICLKKIPTKRNPNQLMTTFDVVD